MIEEKIIQKNGKKIEQSKEENDFDNLAEELGNFQQRNFDN